MKASAFKLIVLIGLVGCQTAFASPTAIPFSPTTPAAKKGSIRINLPTNPGIADVTVLMALDDLRSQGYKVETTDFAQFDLMTVALVKGDLDIASGSNQLSWTAIAKGAPIRSIIGWNADPYYLVARREIQSCADLNAKTVALNVSKGTFATMFDLYLKQHCPGTASQIIVIPAANNRVPGLLSGQVDAALLKLDGKLEVERESPGKFNPIINFAQEFPQVVISGYSVRQEFAAQHPEIVRDIVRANVIANRRVQDRQALYAAIAKYLPTDANTHAVADAYLAQSTWDLNGGWTPERLQSTFDFFKTSAQVPENLKIEDVADLSYLNAVLDEIGRK